MRRQQLEDAREFVGEAQIQQAICLVQHQRFHGRKAQCVLVNQVKQAPWCCHDDVCTTAQAHHLRIDRYAAEHDGGFDRHRQMLRDAVNHLPQLRCQLARGHQNQHRDR